MQVITLAQCQHAGWVGFLKFVDVFKKGSDKFWCNQAVRFDWKASLTETGNRLEISLDNSLYCIFEMDN